MCIKFKINKDVTIAVVFGYRNPVRHTEQAAYMANIFPKVKSQMCADLFGVADYSGVHPIKLGDADGFVYKFLTSAVSFGDDGISSA